MPASAAGGRAGERGLGAEALDIGQGRTRDAGYRLEGLLRRQAGTCPECARLAEERRQVAATEHGGGVVERTRLGRDAQRVAADLRREALQEREQVAFGLDAERHPRECGLAAERLERVPGANRRSGGAGRRERFARERAAAVDDTLPCLPRDGRGHVAHRAVGRRDEDDLGSVGGILRGDRAAAGHERRDALRRLRRAARDSGNRVAEVSEGAGKHARDAPRADEHDGRTIIHGSCSGTRDTRAGRWRARRPRRRHGRLPTG